MVYKIQDSYINKVTLFMDEFMKENKNSLNKNMTEEECLYLLKDFADDHYDNGKKKTRKLTHKIISHSIRVLENLKLILCNLASHGYKFNINELNSMYIAAIFHDVGKIITENTSIKNKDHNIISYLIVKYLLDLDSGIKSYNKNSILEMIFMHSNKKKKRDKISIYTKIIRDADLFDERCGDSLFDLLRDLTICENTNLNSYNSEAVDLFIKQINSSSSLSYINERINVKLNKDLYQRELKRAMTKYYEYLDKPKVKTFMEDLHKEIFKDQYLYINIEI